MNKRVLISSLVVGMTVILVGAAYGRDSGVEYATVITATPVVRSVAVTVPRQECPQPGAAINGSNSHHAIERGTLAAGGRAGSVLPAARLFAAGSSSEPVAAGSGEPCRMTMVTLYEDRIDGYDVTYRYNGHVYQTRMPYDPGRRVPVRVDSRHSRD